MRKMVRQARSGLLFAPAAGDREGARRHRPLPRRAAALPGEGVPPGWRRGGFQPIAVATTAAGRGHAAGPRNSFEFSFPQGILWGIIGCAATFGVGLVAERNAGTLVRLLATPLTRTQVLLGKAARPASRPSWPWRRCCSRVGGLGLRRAAASSPLLLAAAASPAAVAFVGLMMLISTLGQTERSASGAGWAILLVMSMLGGGMVPLFVMPAWMADRQQREPGEVGGARARGCALARLLAGGDGAALRDPPGGGCSSPSRSGPRAFRTA